jgi:hypothetical protein
MPVTSAAKFFCHCDYDNKSRQNICQGRGYMWDGGGMSGIRLSIGARTAVALAALVLGACDPHIFTINNGTECTVTAVLIYEERTQDRGLQVLQPGDGRTVGAWEFKDSRFARVEGYDADGRMIYCHRFTRPGEGDPPDSVVIIEGRIDCESFRPFQTPISRPATPRPSNGAGARR